jgi:hypothetical protein
MPPRARDSEPGAALSLRGWALEAEAAAGIARSLAPTAFVPEHLRVYRNPKERDPDKRVLDLDATVVQVTAVLLAGQELEFGPMASLRAFVIIRGTVALYAIAARALLLRAGHEVLVVESTSSRAIVKARRAGSDDWQTSTWDLDRAKLAGLWPGHADGNWRKQTKAMLVARSTAEACRWVAADAMLGLPLIAEEVADGDELLPAPDGAATGHEEPSGATARGSTAKRRSSAARAALPSGPPLPVPEQQPDPEPPSSAPPPGTPKPTPAQSAKLHAGLRDLGITGPEEGLALVSAWAGRRIDRTSHLTRDEINVVIQRLDALRAMREGDRREDQPADADDQGQGQEEDGAHDDAEHDE